MRYDENRVEVALILLKNQDWANLHSTMKDMSDEEQAHVQNQMELEEELEYDAWVKENQEPEPADFLDEISKYEGTNN